MSVLCAKIHFFVSEANERNAFMILEYPQFCGSILLSKVAGDGLIGDKVL